MAFNDILKQKELELNYQRQQEMLKAMSPISVQSLDDEYVVEQADDTFSRSDRYLWYSQYQDDDYSTIDKQKNINLSKNQINLTQEENSQVIPFMMDRYFDGVDLTQMLFQIHFVNEEGNEATSTPINFQYSSNKIKFYFLVPAEATAVEGKLAFEILAIGTNEKGDTYRWRTKPNEDLKVLRSLAGDGVIEPSQGWDTYLELINQKVIQAQNSADEAKKSAQKAEDSVTTVNDKINTASSEITANVKKEMASELNKYYEKTDATVLGNRVTAIEKELETFQSDPTEEWVTAYDKKTEEKISSAVGKVETSLNGFQEDVNNFKEQVSSDLEDIHKNIDDLPTTLETDYYKKETVDSLLATKASQTDLNTVTATANTNKTNLNAISQKIVDLEEEINAVDKSPKTTYDFEYNDTENPDVGENGFVVYEIQNEGDPETEVKTIKKKFIIVGGSGGSGGGSTLKIEYITKTPYVTTINDKAIIKFKFSGTDASGDDVLEGNATWKVNNKAVATSTVSIGENEFDITRFITIGKHKVTLSITDDAGSVVTKSWTVQQIDVRIESSFDDTLTYPLGTISFNYTPYGAIEKDIHFKLDGNEIGKVTTSSSGIPTSYTLPSQTHGSHLLETYITANLNNSLIESNHIYKDIIWYDSNSDIPVISCIHSNITVKQYDTTNIVYSVYDPKTENPTVTLAVDGKTVSTLKLDVNTQTWQYKSSDIGSHVLTITCGRTVKTINVEVEKLDIDVEPVTAGLEFDFNPVGRSNNDKNRLWSDGKTDVSMSVSNNFDWVNGGYQLDENGDQYFCIKAGTTATINYNLFADDPKKTGKEFKVIFKTTKVRNRKTSFITCMENNIGLDMKIESANIYSSNDSLYSPYCEDDIIEFEFNINRNTDIPMALTYEDGTANRPMIYTADASFIQSNPQPITIGSEDCDVHIYRMKAYSASLSDRDILSNFIADARNAEEMIQRYNRNQIYDENGSLDPYVLAEKCPDLRIILVDCPRFTTDKSDKVANTNITMIYKNGDPVLDNWTCIGAMLSGQGTSSNEYGYSGRNQEYIMDGDDAVFTLGDGESTAKTITLTRNSTPTDYLNFKCNIASSENENNAQMTMRFNQYQPYIRPARLADPKKRDTMEFYNTVVFVREYNEDLSTHNEFNDSDKFHYYALGNIGDSKKTDDTRVFDKNDPKEFCVEIMDYNVALAEFPTGKVDESGKKVICPESEWKTGNTAYDYLYAPYKYKDGEFKSFGSESYEFRYEKKGITEGERQANIDAWREMYKFVVTSDDEKFKADFDKYFVKDSVLYFYLFTERYLMIDNRAKNLFINYAKAYFTQEEAAQFKTEYGVEIQSEYIDDTQAAIRNGYRFNLTWGYDFDSCLGIDNTGKLVLTYGQEDVDYYTDGDPSSGYIYRAAESTFFCRVRDLFKSELEAMFVERESAGAWSASGLINQWDKAQSQFPEEIWRLDTQRKYLRTYLGVSIDNSIVPKEGAIAERFLKNMLNGRKKYQRRMFERNQELYMATKYFGNRATQDQIMMRFNNPTNVETDFTLYLTPYSDMYIGVKFGNFTPINFRAKAGQQYTVPYTLDTADITLIYGASFIQSIGDLSKCYVGDNDFSKASRLKSLSVGSDEVGYSNGFMTNIGLGSNELLEYLDIRNITGLNSVVDLSSCGKLLELHAEGSGATGVIFANGGKLQKAYLPSIISLTAKNLSDIKEFNVETYNKLQTLIVENTPFINTYNIINSAPNLNIVRLIGMNWDKDYHIEDAAILNRLLTIRGIGNDGYETLISSLSGNFYSAMVKQKELEIFTKTWKDLSIGFDTMIEQYTVTFKNEDGTILDVQYVDKGANAVDPITREENPIPTPTKESTVSHDFTFSKWDSTLSSVFSDRVITATYTPSLRRYTVKYVAKGVTMQEISGLYGETVFYTGSTPVYTTEEPAYVYYLFDRWDQSGYINGNKTINAIFSKCEYKQGYFDGKELADLTPVEIYAMTKLKLETSVLEDMDEVTIPVGMDYHYDDIESQVIVSEKTSFDGSNYIDTQLKLFEEDRDFVLAIDYEFCKGATTNSVIAQCFQSNGSNGFKLWYGSGAKFTWGTSSANVGQIDYREMLVIRHKKGENNLWIYNSNLGGSSVSISEMTRTKSTSTNSTLVLGALKADDGSFENHTIGNVYWCKVWFTDLGEDICKELAEWTHENITLNVCGFKKYYLSDNPSQRCSFSLLASHLLERDRSLSNVQVNTGGWAEMTLNSFLNERLYKAFPLQWKLLIKKVSVLSSIGGKSNDTSTSECYITIPACIEVNSAMEREPYIYEGTSISFLTTNESRKRAYDGGDYSSYWLRSPNAFYTNYVYQVDADGALYGYSYPSDTSGVLIEVSI